MTLQRTNGLVVRCFVCKRRGRLVQKARGSKGQPAYTMLDNGQYLCSVCLERIDQQVKAVWNSLMKEVGRVQKETHSNLIVHCIRLSV